MSDLLPKRERVPEYHYLSPHSKALIETLEGASLKAKAALEDVISQFFVDTATWGLSLWEYQVGIKTDLSLSEDARRAAIKKSLVASGNTTAEMIAGLAESITGYKAEIVVHEDYSFSLQFFGEKNELADVDSDEIIGVVEQIKPAHLRFVITSLTWGDLICLGNTWGYYGQWSWGEIANKFYVHAKNN